MVLLKARVQSRFVTRMVFLSTRSDFGRGFVLQTLAGTISRQSIQSMRAPDRVATYQARRSRNVNMTVDQRSELVSGMALQMKKCQSAHDRYLEAHRALSTACRLEAVSFVVMLGSVAIAVFVGASLESFLPAFGIALGGIGLHCVCRGLRPVYKANARRRGAAYVRVCRQVQKETPYVDFCELLGLSGSIITWVGNPESDESWLEELPATRCLTHLRFLEALDQARDSLTAKPARLSETRDRLLELSRASALPAI